MLGRYGPASPQRSKRFLLDRCGECSGCPRRLRIRCRWNPRQRRSGD
ncbi:MAG: hypothetical protein DLM50_02005 [Candidatus Meridianibacter frigidus]|nr:MAG: hypothetical protein DLM50_02005 [Candidatus Eremiobacteraeota bacterium]